MQQLKIFLRRALDADSDGWVPTENWEAATKEHQKYIRQVDKVSGILGVVMIVPENSGHLTRWPDSISFWYEAKHTREEPNRRGVEGTFSVLKSWADYSEKGVLRPDSLYITLLSCFAVGFTFEALPLTWAPIDEPPISVNCVHPLSPGKTQLHECFTQQRFRRSGND